MLLTRLFIAIVFYYQAVLCKKLCDFDDFKCLTAAAQRVKVFPTARPIHLDFIEEDLPTVKYTLTNATLSGINTCISEMLKIYTKNQTYDYNVACKKLVMNGLYEINGELGLLHMEGKGELQIDYDDYVFMFSGENEPSFDNDGKVHNHIKNFKLSMKARGKVVYNFKNLFNGDSDKAATVKKYLLENGLIVDEILRQPVMEKFMTLLVERINLYLHEVPVEKLFTEA